MKSLKFALAAVLIGAVTFTSCLKKNYDGPPDMSGYDPNLPVNYTISQLSAKALSVTGYVKIDSDYTIQGIVVADDRSGNFYKQIVLQDATGGIGIMINAYDLYGDYPVGRKIYIKLKGLYIGNYHKLPQVGYAVDNTGSLVDIPGNVISNYIVKADFKDPKQYPDRLPLKHITLAEAASAPSNLLNTLVTIDSVLEFGASVAGSGTYAQPADIASATDVYADDCSGTNIDVRSSGYANFASYLLPAGRGSLTGILTVYNTTAQLIIRDTSDVQFHGTRCDGAVIIDPNKIVFREDFQTVSTNNEILTTSGWTNYDEVGGVKYKGGVLGSTTKFAKISAFGTSQAIVKSWLISPAINLTGATNPMLSFKSDDGYDNGASLKVYVSTNYTSGDPTTATWTEITGFTISSGHTSGYGSSFLASGLKSLSAYTGTIHVAFKYEGGDPAQSTTFELDDVTVSKD